MQRRFTPSPRASRRFSGVAEISGVGATAVAQRDPNAAANATFAPLEMGQDMGGGRAFGGYVPDDPEEEAGKYAATFDPASLAASDPAGSREAAGVKGMMDRGLVSKSAGAKKLQEIAMRSAGRSAGTDKPKITALQGITEVKSLFEQDLSDPTGVATTPDAFAGMVAKADKHLETLGITDPAERDSIIKGAGNLAKGGQGGRIEAGLQYHRAKSSEEAKKQSSVSDAAKAQSELDALLQVPGNETNRGASQEQIMAAQAKLHNARKAQGWDDQAAKQVSDAEAKFNAIKRGSYDRGGKAFTPEAAKAVDTAYGESLKARHAADVDASHRGRTEAWSRWKALDTDATAADEKLTNFNAMHPDDNEVIKDGKEGAAVTAADVRAGLAKSSKALKAKADTERPNLDAAEAKLVKREQAHSRANRGLVADNSTQKSYYAKAKASLALMPTGTPEQLKAKGALAAKLAKAMLEDDGYKVPLE